MIQTKVNWKKIIVENYLQYPKLQSNVNKIASHQQDKTQWTMKTLITLTI